MRFKSCFLVSSLSLACLLLVSCQPFVNSRGNVVAEKQFESFAIGKTTMGDVLESCGTPSLHKDNFTWIYVGGRSEETSFKGVEMRDRVVIRLTFGADRILRNKEIVRSADSDGGYDFDEETTDLISNKEAGTLLNKPHV